MLRDRIRPFIPQIISRELTNRDLARQLSVSESHICRVLKQLKVVRDPLPDNAPDQALAQARKEFRLQAAKTMSIEAAARAANCSTRTIYRFRKKNGP